MSTTTRSRSVAPTTTVHRLLPPPGTTADLAAHTARWGPLPAPPAAALLAAVDDVGLLGRGGAGFPMARKLRAVAQQRGPAVVVANGCESEPASHKDHTLLRRAPHLVLDGVALAAAAVGATEAYLVVHDDGSASPVRAAVTRALAERGDAVPVVLRTVPARYTASEETALVHALNGGDAVPLFTPPRPFQSGVRGRPTLVHNVESLTHLAALARGGPDWFRAVGDPDEPGTVLITVHPAGGSAVVLEVPTGTPVAAALAAARQVSSGTAASPGSVPGSDAGAGSPAGGAVLLGGYFGRWLPAGVADRVAVSARGARAAGTGLGAGVVAELPAGRCGLAETARVLTWLAAHTAGQCGPCVNGLPALATAVQQLARGDWDAPREESVQRWLRQLPGRGACRLPDGAVALAASALVAFSDDAEQHRAGRPCPAAGLPGVLPVPAGAVPAPRRRGALAGLTGRR